MTPRSGITVENQQIKPRVLVASANHGTKNRRFLDRLLEEYRSMRGFDVDIVVHSNIPKELGPDIEVIVGLPSEDPWSLPFAHKQLFAERREDYDLFIYTEDDTLLTERKIAAFVEATQVLPQDCIAGFMRFEVDPQGRKFCSSIHSHYHWDVHSVVRHGDSLFAYYTNEHAGCFILTRDQLIRAMASGGFLLPPERRGYGMPETAATDPYTQCGMRKLICISHFDDFCLHHMANAYLGELGLDTELVRLELAKLASFVTPGVEPPVRTLFEPFPLRDGDRRNKAYYEHRRDDVLNAIPADMRRILSVGCGCGTTEAELVKCGIAVAAVPLDPVIATSAAVKGIEILPADFRLAAETLEERRFDCILMLDILQQLHDPVAVIRKYREFLDEQGVLLVSVPNWNYCGILRKRLSKGGREAFECRTSGHKPGVHKTTAGSVTKWLREAGLQRIRRRGMPQERYRRWSRATLGMADDLLCEKILLLAGR
jgi:SAM-dependent methyltransferase